MKNKFLKVGVPFLCAAPVVGIATTTAVILLSQGPEVVPFDQLIIKDGVLKGFKNTKKLGDCTTLLIPKEVTHIDDFAFFDGGRSTIPQNIKYLRFELSQQVPKSQDLLQTNVTIGKAAFYKAPIEFAFLPVGVRKIEALAFSHSNLIYCNFPEYLNSIGEEAFSYTNLVEVEFNDLRQQIAIDDDKWFGEEREVQEGSYVKYVGKKAFFNCQSLVYHKPTCYGAAYQLDDDEIEMAQSPFATIDDAGKVVGSKIKTFDYSNFYLDDTRRQVLTQNPINAFGVNIDDPNSSGLFIFNDYKHIVGQEADAMKIVNQVLECWSQPTLASFTYSFKIGANQTWNPAFASGYEMVIKNTGSWTEDPYSWVVDSKQAKKDGLLIDMMSIRRYAGGDEVLADDIKVYVGDIAVDGEPRSDIQISITQDETNPLQFKVTFDGNIKVGQKITFSPTFYSEKYGIKTSYKAWSDDIKAKKRFKNFIVEIQ